MSTVLEGGTPPGSQEQSRSSTPVDGRQQQPFNPLPGQGPPPQDEGVCQARDAVDVAILNVEMELLGLEDTDLTLERMTELIGEAKEYSRELVKHKVFLRRAESANYSANIEPGLEDAMTQLRKVIRDLENRRCAKAEARQAEQPLIWRPP